MKRIWLSVRAFFLVLFRRDVAERVESALSAQAPPAVEKAPPAEKRPARSEGLTLLETLQREARFVDFVQESLDGYSDAQVGAAVRDVHRECRTVLQRLFGLKPIVAQQEGSDVEVPPDFDAGRYRLAGRVVGQPPFHGRLVHHGWEAVHCDLPAWSGSEQAARVVAPAEVEVQ